jgi:hypothetical protein
MKSSQDISDSNTLITMVKPDAIPVEFRSIGQINSADTLLVELTWPHAFSKRMSECNVQDEKIQEYSQKVEELMYETKGYA